ncbi:MAG: hypothetical protein QF714_01070 [Dehalococcoidia bacterium]|nr:hypothetical protein [Dehalococcoidia bacterium]MDP6226289.1 hypothetical protein [Dehalococcoidia bacterium]MDP7083306.1 hypothetical protein [Dehalococcoidia bacterium]MDP7200668.1 hypothetical protein [Dehalococcoidia bacterium]MDP7509655.1 hypothetical protein [Dehalococcoidia bacterium]
MAELPGIRITPRAAVALLAAALVAALLVLVAMALLGEYTKTRGRLLLTALSLAGFCLVAVAPAALHQRRRYPLAAAGGLAAASVGFMLLVGGTWGTPDSDAYWKTVAVVAIVAVSLSHVCWLLLLEPQRPSARIARWTAMGSASLVALLAGSAIILEVKAAPYWWAVTVIIIAQVAGGVAAPLLSRLGRARHWPGGVTSPKSPPS